MMPGYNEARQDRQRRARPMVGTSVCFIWDFSELEGSWQQAGWKWMARIITMYLYLVPEYVRRYEAVTVVIGGEKRVYGR